MRPHGRKTWAGGALWLIAAGLVLGAGPIRVTATAESAGQALGVFRVTYYYVAQEVEGGDWPLYGPACQQVLAHTSQGFHRELSLEGTGSLRDGRLLNFSERCACARPGFRGSRICYEVLDRNAFPWGRGAQLGEWHFPLVPFRTVAVDPELIPLGTILYVPAWRGRRWPDGSVSDGCVRAEDTGSLIRQRHLDLFVGRPEWGRELQGSARLEPVRVYRGENACRTHAARGSAG